MTSRARRAQRPQIKVLSLAVAACFSASVSTSALANPNGFSVVNGQVTFSYNGNTLTITNTPGSIINWQSFSIGAGELTKIYTAVRLEYGAQQGDRRRSVNHTWRVAV